MLSQGERVRRPGPVPGWALRRSLIPSLLLRAKKALSWHWLFSAHFPLFNPLSLAEALGGSSVSWSNSPGWAPFRTGTKFCHKVSFAPSATVSFLPVEPWEVSCLRKEQYPWASGSRHFHSLTPFHNYIPFRASVGISLKSISDSRCSV